MDEVTALPEWVDGPRFAEWLDQVRPDYRDELTEHLSRTVARLREPGTKGKVDTADRICVALFLHLSEIPDEVWTFDPPNRGRKVDEKQKAEALAMVESGVPPAEVARRLQVHYMTVRRWAGIEAA